MSCAVEKAKAEKKKELLLVEIIADAAIAKATDVCVKKGTKQKDSKTKS